MNQKPSWTATLLVALAGLLLFAGMYRAENARAAVVNPCGAGYAAVDLTITGWNTAYGETVQALATKDAQTIRINGCILMPRAE